MLGCVLGIKQTESAPCITWRAKHWLHRVVWELSKLLWGFIRKLTQNACDQETMRGFQIAGTEINLPSNSIFHPFLKWLVTTELSGQSLTRHVPEVTGCRHSVVTKSTGPTYCSFLVTDDLIFNLPHGVRPIFPPGFVTRCGHMWHHVLGMWCVQLPRSVLRNCYFFLLRSMWLEGLALKQLFCTLCEKQNRNSLGSWQLQEIASLFLDYLHLGLFHFGDIKLFLT